VKKEKGTNQKAERSDKRKLIWHARDIPISKSQRRAFMTSVPQLGEIIKRVLQQEADRAGKTTGFIKRVREFTGATFAQTMILGQMQLGEVSLSDLAQFARYRSVNVSAQAIDKRFDERTVAFFAEVLNATFTQVVAADPVALPLLSRFSQVIVEDSSTFGLPDMLAMLWQGCGGKYQGTLSALKVHVRWDLLVFVFDQSRIGTRQAAGQPIAVQTEPTPTAQLAHRRFGLL
jgi:hypothetical protein